MKVVLLYMMMTGEIAVQILDESGSPITTDVGIGTPFGEVHLTDVSKLEELGFSKDDILDLPYIVDDYSYLPEMDESEKVAFVKQVQNLRNMGN